MFFIYFSYHGLFIQQHSRSMCGDVFLLEISWTGPVTLSPVPPQVTSDCPGEVKLKSNILPALANSRKLRKMESRSESRSKLLAQTLVCGTEIEDITQLFPKLCTHPSCRWFLYLHQADSCNHRKG